MNEIKTELVSMQELIKKKPYNHRDYLGLKVTESLIIGFDKTYEDESMLTVTNVNGHTFQYVNTFTGKEAEDLYEKLTGRKLERSDNNEIIGSVKV